MKHDRLIFALMTLLALVPAADGLCGEHSEHQAWQTNHAIVEIAVDQGYSATNCPLQITITSRDRPLSVYVSGGIPAGVIKVQDQHGMDCPYTEYGKSVINQTDEFSVFMESIPSGASRTWTLPLEKYFMLTPGKWWIEVAPFVDVIRDKPGFAFGEQRVDGGLWADFHGKPKLDDIHVELMIAFPSNFLDPIDRALGQMSPPRIQITIPNNAKSA
jgi:hypothetical protein